MYKYLFFLITLFLMTSCEDPDITEVEAESETDTQAPTVPTAFTVSNITVNSVDLSWEDSSDNVSVTGYTIYLDGNETAEVTSTSYTVNDLSPNTEYTFAVSAFDAAGNESLQSASETITTGMVAPSVNKVLVFTKTAGFNHNTKDESVAMVESFTTIFNLEVTVDDTGSEFDTAANLNEYDIIFFTNTSGNTLNQSQRDNVESYAAQGGNFISNHAASDSYGHSTASTVNGGGKGEWDWYAENVTGCSVRNGPNHTANNFPATVTIENQNSELLDGLPFPWDDNEEWYYWEGGYLDSNFTELLRVSDTGPNSFDDPRMTAHYWERPSGGTSFYSSMGHAKSKFSDPEFVQLITNAFDLMLD